MSEPIAEGTQAPDFTLKASDNSTVTLSDLRGQKVILAFYPAAFSPGCQNQMEAYTKDAGEFESHGAKIYGISVDNAWSLRAWKEARGISIELLADFVPHGAVSRAYGVFNEEPGTASRVTFVIDEQGVIRDVQTAERGSFQSVDALCSALDHA
ncbi:MAG: redoxin domain-containing protein [Thermomicrobiales bacterium]|nr:redoxin domain-containing protein [Thermomicrobiales bacterium]